MTTRKYSSRSQQTTLSAALTSSGTSATVVSGTSLLGGVTISAGQTFTVVIDPDTALEEIVDVTAVATNTLTITRGIDGSSGVAHSAGAVVRHMAIGRDYREANEHIEDSTGIHGIASTSSVVGTEDTQTLTNKTLTSPTITSPTITGAGVDVSIVFEGSTADAYETTLTVIDPTADRTITLPNATGTVVLDTLTQTLTNKTLTSPTLSGTPVITGLSSAGMVSSSATPKDYVDSILGSATAASTSAASAATSATSAAASATAAATSASSASTSATSSATSATAAATSATSSATSATAAATSASSAATSASSAATSATSAANSATAAAASVATIASYASAAATSATSAATSATSAANSATASASSASAAATSASSAATSATSAATSATSAAASAASAAATLAGAIQATIVDAKGDLIVGTAADTVSRLAVGTNGYTLTANSATATGLAWAAVDSLPSQTSNSGKFLTTDGSTASWAVVAGSLAQPSEPASPNDGQIWVDTDGSVVGQAMTRWSKAPTGGTTSLTGADDNSLTLSYTVGYEQVYRNGVLLSRGNDYTATNGTSITLTDATITGDIIEVFASAVLAIADVYTQTQADNKYATITSAQTLTNKTLTAPIITDAIVKGLNEDVNVVASAATGTINFDVSTASVWYYTSNATANHTLNFRYSSGTSLNTFMATGDAITVVWLNTNGSTAYYPNTIQIDGTTVTPKVPAAISAGNASAIDAYSFTIIKTASATFTVLETQTKFA
jgi:hypothetical protein